MAQACEADNVKYLCGMIAADATWFDRVLEPLTELLGPVDMVSETWPFDLTHYYDAEMGNPLWRRFVAFAQPASPGRLAEVKRATNDIEAEMANTAARAARTEEQRATPHAAAGDPTTACGLAGGAHTVARPVNLDPGYIAPAKLVLASMKDFSHRVYLGGGVYAEVTLQWRGGRWRAHEWTFPDFASGGYDAFLTAVRQRLRDSRPTRASQETE